MASEETWVVGSMFKAFAIMAASFQSIPKQIRSADDLKSAMNIIKESIDKLRELLAELEGDQR